MRLNAVTVLKLRHIVSTSPWLYLAICMKILKGIYSSLSANIGFNTDFFTYKF